MTARPLDQIRSDLRGWVHLAPATAVCQEKFAKLLREAKAACSPREWTEVLGELSISQQTADYYLGLK